MFEFVSVTKYLLFCEMEGLFQLIPLKIFKYFAIWVGFIIERNYINRIIFFVLDIIMILGIIKIHNTTLSFVYHNYNMKIGSDTRIRNAYVIRNFFEMTRFFYVTLSMFQVFVFITYGGLNFYKIYVIVKLIALLFDYFVSALSPYEDRRAKILSLCIYFGLALGDIYIVVETIVLKK
jgi:hypothetical protein